MYCTVVRMCCTGVFIVETMLRVVINDEIKQLILPTNTMERIWNKKRSPYYEGGIEKLVPFNYPALLSRYIESVIFDIPRENGEPVRYPALTKLKIGNFDTIGDLNKAGHSWKLMNSYNVTREYLEFLHHLAPASELYSRGVQSSEFTWPLDNNTGVLPTSSHANFSFRSMFDLFQPKLKCTVGKYIHLSEISLNNLPSLTHCDLRGIELFSAIGKSVPSLRILDISQTLLFSAELILYLVFQDAWQSLHSFMFLQDYRVLTEAERCDHYNKHSYARSVQPNKDSEVKKHSFDRYCPWCYDEGECCCDQDY